MVRLWLWPTTESTSTKNTPQSWQFWWPCGHGGVMRGELSDGVHPWLHAKPLDATIGWVPTPYCPGSRHDWRLRMKQKNPNKTQLLPSFLMVDQRKKAKQFQDPKQTLYSRHWCDKLRTNVKHNYLSWRAQLHFELSNVVNGQKFKMPLTLNKAHKNLWAKHGPIVVKLLRHNTLLTCCAWVFESCAALQSSYYQQAALRL